MLRIPNFNTLVNTIKTKFGKYHNSLKPNGTSQIFSRIFDATKEGDSQKVNAILLEVYAHLSVINKSKKNKLTKDLQQVFAASKHLGINEDDVYKALIAIFKNGAKPFCNSQEPEEEDEDTIIVVSTDESLDFEVNEEISQQNNLANLLIEIVGVYARQESLNPKFLQYTNFINSLLIDLPCDPQTQYKNLYTQLKDAHPEAVSAVMLANIKQIFANDGMEDCPLAKDTDDLVKTITRAQVERGTSPSPENIIDTYVDKTELYRATIALLQKVCKATCTTYNKRFNGHYSKGDTTFLKTLKKVRNYIENTKNSETALAIDFVLQANKTYYESTKMIVFLENYIDKHQGIKKQHAENVRDKLNHFRQTYSENNKNLVHIDDEGKHVLNTDVLKAMRDYVNQQDDVMQAMAKDYKSKASNSQLFMTLREQGNNTVKTYNQNPSLRVLYEDSAIKQSKIFIINLILRIAQIVKKNRRHHIFFKTENYAKDTCFASDLETFVTDVRTRNMDLQKISEEFNNVFNQDGRYSEYIKDISDTIQHEITANKHTHAAVLNR